MPVAQFKVKKPTRPRDTRDSCDTRPPNDRTELRELLTGHASAEMAPHTKSAAPSALADSEWNFRAVPDEQMEACYLYEYGREFFKSSSHLQRFHKEWNGPRAKRKGKHLAALLKAWDLLETRCKNFPYIDFDFFPKTAWQDLPVLPKTAHRRIEINLRQCATERVNEWAAHHRKFPSDRFHIETQRQCEPPNIRTIESFRDYHEWFHRKQDLGNTEYGFFAINWDYKNHQIIESFTHWLNEQREARRTVGLKEAKPTASRGGFGDRLNWLGALRVRNHYPHRVLVEYPSGRIKLGNKSYQCAPYAFYSELLENARKAEQEIARMFPQDWSEAAFRRRQAEAARFRQEPPMFTPPMVPP